MDSCMGCVDSFTENHQCLDLLAEATNSIEQISNENFASEQLWDWLDWMAFLTREYFGMQHRLLRECSQQHQMLQERIAIHKAFRDRLADICKDALNPNISALRKLHTVCNDLINDMQAERETMLNLIQAGLLQPRLRNDPRKGNVVANPWH